VCLREVDDPAQTSVRADDPPGGVADLAGFQVIVLRNADRHLERALAVGATPDLVRYAVGDGAAPTRREGVVTGPEPRAAVLALLEPEEPVIGPLTVQVRVQDWEGGLVAGARAPPDVAVLDVLVENHRLLKVRVGGLEPERAATGATEVVDDILPVLARVEPVVVGQVDLVRHGDVLDVRKTLNLPRRFTRAGEDGEQHGC